MRRLQRFLFPCVPAVVLLGLAACVDTPVKPEQPLAMLVFPPPPERARLVFERTLRGSADLKVEDATSRLRELVTGERDRGRGFAKPFDVVTCKGRIYVSDTAARLVMAFDVPGHRFFDIGADEPGTLRKPLGLNVDGRCNLYVADGTSRRVMVYDRDGKFLSAIGGKKWFHRLSHVAVTADGKRLFAVDTGGVGTQEHRVRVFDVPSGRHLYDIGTRGTEPGQFNLPRDVELVGGGLLYVVDGANFRVQVLREDGTFVRSFGDIGSRSGQFSRPKGIAVGPAGNVYVSDAAFGNFQIFNPEGQLLLFVGARSAQPERAKYMLPAGIDVDEDGRVYMVDQFFRKVDIYRPAGLEEGQGYLGAWNRAPAAKKQ